MPRKSASVKLQQPAHIHGDTTGLEQDRVHHTTTEHIHKTVDEKTRDAVRLHSSLGKEAMTLRLSELDREISQERAFMTGAGTVVWLGFLLGRFVNRRAYRVSAIAGSFLLLYALIGWAPPVVLLRRLGFRTARQIDLERMALKALRGDFDHVSEAEPSNEVRGDKALRAAYYPGGFIY